MNSNDILRIFNKYPKIYFLFFLLAIISILLYSYIVYLENQTKIVYHADVIIDLEKDLNSGKENVLLRVFLSNVYHGKKDYFICDKEGFLIDMPYTKCPSINLINGAEGYQLINDPYLQGHWIAGDIKVGDYLLTIDIENDGKVDGTINIPIERKIRLISPLPNETISNFDFILKWDEKEKEKSDELLLRLNPNYKKRYGIVVEPFKGYQEAISINKPPLFLKDYSITENTNFLIQKHDMDANYLSGIFKLSFINNYLLSEPQEQDKIKFSSIYLSEKTTLLLNFGNYTPINGQTIQ